MQFGPVRSDNIDNASKENKHEHFQTSKQFAYWTRSATLNAAARSKSDIFAEKSHESIDLTSVANPTPLSANCFKISQRHSHYVNCERCCFL